MDAVNDNSPCCSINYLSDIKGFDEIDLLCNLGFINTVHMRRRGAFFQHPLEYPEDLLRPAGDHLHRPVAQISHEPGPVEPGCRAHDEPPESHTQIGRAS